MYTSDIFLNTHKCFNNCNKTINGLNKNKNVKTIIIKSCFDINLNGKIIRKKSCIFLSQLFFKFS